MVYDQDGIDISELEDLFEDDGIDDYDGDIPTNYARIYGTIMDIPLSEVIKLFNNYGVWSVINRNKVLLENLDDEDIAVLLDNKLRSTMEIEYYRRDSSEIEIRINRAIGL